MGQARDSATGDIWEVDDATGAPIRIISGPNSPQQASGPRVLVGPDPIKMRREERANAAADRSATASERAAAAADRQAGAAERTAANTNFDNRAKLRTEFNGLPEVKDYKATMSALGGAWKAPNNAQGDLAVIYSFAKIMDPGSVVREGEMDMANSTSSTIQDIYRRFGKINNGNRLPAPVRKQLIDTAAQKAAALNHLYSQARKTYGDMATADGFDPKEVIGNHVGDSFRDMENGYRKSEGATFADYSGMATGAAPDMVELARGDTKTEKVVGPVEKQIAAMLKGGASSDKIKQFVAQNAPGMKGVDAALAWRSMHPNYKGTYDVSTTKVVPTTVLNKISASPLATVATQASNAALAGGLDEGAGALKSLVTGDPLSETIASANLVKQLQAQANPKSALAGNVLGGAAAMIGGTAALRGAGIGRGAWAAANPIKAAALGDAGYGATYGALENNDNRLMGAAIGAPAALVGSLAGSAATNAAGRVVRGVVNPAAERLRARGIPLTVGEVMGGGWKKLQDAGTSVWGPGNLMSARYGEGRQALNEAAFNEAGQTVGQPINAVGQQGIQALDAAKSAAYSDALDPVTLDLTDPRFADSMDPIGNVVARIPEANPARQELTDTLVHRVRSNMGPDGTMTGRNFQEAYRGLARAPKERGQAPYAHEFGQATRMGQDALAGALEAQNPDAYRRFLSANSANRHLSILTDAVNAAKNQIDDGNPLFTPAQLGTAATNNTKTFGGKVAAAQGDRPFNQLINDAQEVMSQKIGDSGTAGRALLGGALLGGLGGGAGYGAGGGEGAVAGTVAPLAIMSLLNTRGGQAALTRRLLNRVAPFRRIGNYMVDQAPIGGAIGAAATVPYAIGQ